MMKIISSKICPFVQRVTGLLAAKAVTCKVEYISLKNKPDWFSEISPNAQVPVLITSTGTALFESDAIVEYLDEITDPIEPDLQPEQRALDRAWSYMAVKNYLVQCSAMRSNDDRSFLRNTGKLRQMFQKAESALGTGPFFKGRVMSNVDIAWLPVLHRANIIKTHTEYDFLSGYPKVQVWQQSLFETGIANRSVASDFEEAFADFYLSDQTLLGRRETGALRVDQMR